MKKNVIAIETPVQLIDDYCSIVDRAEMKVVGIKVIYTPDSSDGRSAVRESRQRPIADRPDTLAPKIEQFRIDAGVYEQLVVRSCFDDRSRLQHEDREMCDETKDSP